MKNLVLSFCLHFLDTCGRQLAYASLFLCSTNKQSQQSWEQITEASRASSGLLHWCNITQPFTWLDPFCKPGLCIQT